jgi:hypothetical protein
MPRLNQFIRFIGRKIDDATMRASYITPNGHGSRQLVEIIKLADLKRVTSASANDQDFMSYLLSILKDLEKPLDVRVGKHTYRTLFIRSRTACFELMTPSRRRSPLSDIPFEQAYDHPDWDNIKPLRIVDMGCTDLKFQVHNDYLNYPKRGPTHAVYSVDCLALVAKFTAYYRAQTTVPNIDQCILDFVHNDVIVPALLNDSLAIWLRNIYKQQFLSVSPLESHTSTIWDTINIDSIGSDFTGAMVDIQHIRDDLKKSSISDQVVFSSLIMTPDGQNLTDYYRDLFYTSTTPDEQPWAWVDCLKHLTWWEFIIAIASIAPELPDVISLKRDAIRDVRFWMMFKPWNEIHSSIPYKTMIRSRLEGLYTYLQQG